VPSDESLVEDACAGRQAAFAELAGRYQERLLRFLLTRCRNQADAEDALQDTFINAYRYLDTFNARWRFSTWIYRIAIRVAARQARRDESLEHEVVDPDGDPLLACIRASSRENLWVTARRVLSDDACTALWLHYVEDMPVREISDAMQRSSSWAKVTLMRARNRLAQELGDDAAPVPEGGTYG
jgi:RNA polymerase sigma-70 factor (ECF subfamily)